MKHIIITAALSILCFTFGYCQNTNNGIIIQNNIYVAPPVYYTPVYTTPAYDPLNNPKVKQMMHDIELEHRRKERYASPTDMALFDKYASGSTKSIYSEYPVYYAKSKANLRADPGAKARVLTQLSQGEMVNVIMAYDNWWYVYYPHLKRKGYMHRSVLTTFGF
jgi:hypothetical protein